MLRNTFERTAIERHLTNIDLMSICMQIDQLCIGMLVEWFRIVKKGSI